LLKLSLPISVLIGEDRIDVLSEIWDHYFTETLPTLQAIFYPVQGQELTIRQIALLGFRDLVLLKVKLEEILPLVQTKLPASIIQMLLILQSVHEPTGPSEGYLQLEELVKQVVSPYLGLCEDRSFSGSTCLLERRYSRSHPKTGVLNYSSHMATSRQPSEMALTPLTEQEGEAYLEKCGSIRRHTVANAHSDIQLLAMASMMHTGMVIEESDGTDKCRLLQPSFSHRQCSSEPSIADGPEGVMAEGRQDPAELNCTSVS
ncbi:PRR5L protein, partial [Anhinga rufa]|nr:PRR5L protein [Anhinga rufa]